MTTRYSLVIAACAEGIAYVAGLIGASVVLVAGNVVAFAFALFAVVCFVKE